MSILVKGKQENNLVNLFCKWVIGFGRYVVHILFLFIIHASYSTYQIAFVRGFVLNYFTQPSPELQINASLKLRKTSAKY